MMPDPGATQPAGSAAAACSSTAAVGAAAAAAPRPEAAKLHVLRLPPESDGAALDYSRLDMRWLLEGAADEVLPGDVLHFPELCTGAGEFEGTRFAGRPDDEGLLPLLLCDVESPVFPRAIVDLFPEEGTSRFRTRYEAAFEAIMESQRVSLDDLFGGDVAAFWANPDVQRREPQSEGVWVIAFEQCAKVSADRVTGPASGGGGGGGGGGDGGVKG